MIAALKCRSAARRGRSARPLLLVRSLRLVIVVVVVVVVVVVEVLLLLLLLLLLQERGRKVSDRQASGRDPM